MKQESPSFQGGECQTACRVNEAVTLRIRDVLDRFGSVRPVVLFRKGNTKGKLATRTIPVLEDLRKHLTNYHPPKWANYLFPGRHGKGHITPDAASKILNSLRFCL
ncbi:hypothetical protein [Moorena sp. SIO3B2]|uniref:hypothetical protein n=1 Tax=Moorena sp. SIO3B2 TaxID=2607827 RepID=UPI0013C83F27|nr:hypothetical protein [Moorena sp. SIO3B2]NEP35533.1 hypothetical protein [Moorena sp. SIO3B2]